MSNDWEDEEEGGTDTVTRPKVKKPKLYKVILHNDDYTTMEFVIFVLQTIFRKSEEEANTIMLKVHTSGKGTCGVFTHEIPETKATKASSLAKENSQPLLCTIEPE